MMHDFGKKILFDKHYRVLAHVLFWGFYLFVFSLVSANDLNNLHIGIETTVVFIVPSLIYTYVVLYNVSTRAFEREIRAVLYLLLPVGSGRYAHQFPVPPICRHTHS